MTSLRLLVLTSRFQNAFFTELGAAIATEANGLGVEATLVDRPVELERGDVVVVLPPHEYVTLEGDRWLRDPAVARRTIGVSAEQPGTAHFDDDLEIAEHLGAVFDFSAHSVAAYRRAGIAARHLPFGYTPAWDQLASGDRSRGPEVLFLGAATERRLWALAHLARPLWMRRSRLVLSDNSAPNPGAAASFLTGDAKRRLLADSTLLVNIHQGRTPYFEWLRVAEAAHCGTVVVSEPAIHSEPFVPGEHFEVRTIAGLSPAICDLLDDPARLDELRSAAYDLLRSTPFSTSVASLLDVASSLDTAATGPAVGPLRSAPWRPDRRLPWEEDRTEAHVMRQAMREIRLDLIDLRRQLHADRLDRDEVDATPAVRAASTAAAAAADAPRVSVVIALYNHAAFITGALESVANGTFQDVEVVVVDDGSTDGSAEAVEAWIAENGDQRVTLVRSPLNRGLPKARNTAIAHATGELVFVLDADNEVVPTGLQRLLDAIDEDPAAVAAYGILQRFDSDGPQGLLSVLPWEPSRLRHGNYIDAMALVRTSALRSLGGFAEDRRLHGWEDYDLWCRIAEAGGRAAHVPTIVGRYRTSSSSMLSVTNISVDAAFDALRERAPALMAGLPTGRTLPSVAGADIELAPADDEAQT